MLRPVGPKHGLGGFLIVEHEDVKNGQLWHEVAVKLWISYLVRMEETRFTPLVENAAGSYSCMPPGRLM